MAKTGVVFTLAIVCVVLVSTEDVSNTTVHPEKTILKRADTYPQKDDPSFMSRIASWIFPFGGGGDSVAAETQQSGPQYLPPGNQNLEGYPDKDCNPCNKEPWIPVATDYGKNTIIGFMQPHELQQHQGNLYNQNGGQLIPPQPSGAYGLPAQNYGPPQQNYGTPNPNPPQQNYGPPQQNYGPPEQNQGPPQPDYGPPENNQRPPQQNYGPPEQNHGPPQQNYGPPEQQRPPQQNYGPPEQQRPPQQNYGPPEQQRPPQQTYGAPEKNQGPPQPSYGPPQNQGPPQQTYGPPQNQGPPQQTYGPPQNQGQQTYGPPQENIVPPPQNYGPPAQNYGPPAQNYSPPPQNAIPPVQNYGPPKQPFNPSKGNYGPPPKPFYGPPKNQNHKPRHTYGVPRQQAAPAQLTNQYRPPPPNLIPLKLKPTTKYNNHNTPIRLSTNMKPPPLFAQNYNAPPSSYEPPPAGLVDNNNFRPNYAPQIQNNFAPPYQFGGGNLQLINPDYLPPRTQLPISSAHPGNLLPPIPLPNLSPLPIAPLHNAQPFLDNYPQPGSKVEIHSNGHYGNYNGGNVQIQQSIAVTDFLASIEHPINVIRSPILEVNVANTSSQADFPDEEFRELGLNFNSNGDFKDTKDNEFKSTNNFEENTFQPSNVNFIQPEPVYTNDNPKVYNNLNVEYDSNGFKLSENPIIVDDTHAAASSFNGTYQNENKTENVVYTNVGSSDISADLINQIIKGVDFEATTRNTDKPTYKLQSGGYKETTKEVESQQTYQFTQPSIDYSNWSPKQEIPTSMMPPPIGESFWLTTQGQSGAEVTTKKPKQIQIIIPYTTNTNANHYYDQNQGRKVPPSGFQNTLPLFTQPPKIESVWGDHTKNDIYNSAESQEVTVTDKPTTQVINIKDLFQGQTQSDVNYKNLPFDIIRFQKNIDDWTEQEYANKMLIRLQKATSTTRLVPSKKIPDEYLTTIPYGEIEATTAKDFYDHEPAGSNSKEYKYKEELESNLIATESSTAAGGEVTTDANYKNHKPEKPVRQTWDKIQIAVSPLTKEKVYVVTPVPKLNTTTMSWKASKEANLSTTFSISILPMKNETDLNDVRIVLSEWPHLINNLATTVKPPTSRHPLFGLMDLSSYAPPENSTIQTYSGHSKVINAASAITKKKPSGWEEKKATTIKTTTLKNPT